jgi:hypothetical protein
VNIIYVTAKRVHAATLNSWYIHRMAYGSSIQHLPAPGHSVSYLYREILSQLDDFLLHTSPTVRSSAVPRSDRLMATADNLFRERDCHLRRQDTHTLNHTIREETRLSISLGKQFNSQYASISSSRVASLKNNNNNNNKLRLDIDQ